MTVRRESDADGMAEMLATLPRAPAEPVRRQAAGVLHQVYRHARLGSDLAAMVRRAAEPGATVEYQARALRAVAQRRLRIAPGLREAITEARVALDQILITRPSPGGQ